jgi:AGZA family xanthine/uracil permease-like MFS transporter
MKSKWFVPGDIDGFFGLFIDNLLQLMLISQLCRFVCGFPVELIDGKILPGAALSILVGNLFYSWQAYRLAQKTGRNDITALPYGINTVSLIAFVFFILMPVYQKTKNVELTWQVGLFACLVSSVMEIIGSFFGDILRKHTPRAALLSALAGIAITFISMGFVFQIFQSPVISMVPMMLILIYYGSRLKMPLGIPGGLLAVGIGVALAWLLPEKLTHFHPSQEPFTPTVHFPIPVFKDAFALLTQPDGWKFLSVIFPMALFNLVGSLQNLESAEAAGDRFETRSSLLANGIGGMCAAFFGNPFPTTIYIGHPGWKAMGARIGYSAMNGIVISFLCLVGGVTLVLKFVPLESTLSILLWIGIIITAQAFQEVPKKHALAVAFGLIPSLASWAVFLIETTLRKAGTTLFETASKFGTDIYIYGLLALSQGFLLSAMILAATLVFIIERQFLKAAIWMWIAALLSAIGMIHGYDLAVDGIHYKFGIAVAPEFAGAYLFVGFILIVFSFLKKEDESKQ